MDNTDNHSLRNETILVCALITATIWASAIAAWLSVILAVISMTLIIRSWIIHGDDAETIGFCPTLMVRIEKSGNTNLRAGEIVEKHKVLNANSEITEKDEPAKISYPLVLVGRLAIFVVIALIVIVVIGYLINPEFYKMKNFADKLYQQAFGPYLIWSVIQEGLLNGYFTNRIGKLVKSELNSALIIGLFFAFLHLPNLVLTIGTFFWAGTSSYLFLKYSRNVYLLGFAHSILGTAIKFLIAMPLIGSGCMRVGPGFWR